MTVSARSTRSPGEERLKTGTLVEGLELNGANLKFRLPTQLLPNCVVAFSISDASKIRRGTRRTEDQATAECMHKTEGKARHAQD